MTNFKDIWISVLAKLSEKITRNKVVTFFNSSRIVGVESGVCRVALKNDFVKAWVENTCSAMILSFLKEFNLNIEKLSFEVDLTLSDADNPYCVNLTAKGSNTNNIPKGTQGRKTPNKEEVVVKGIRSKRLNSKYGLCNFVVGQGTRLAHAACSAVAFKPGDGYNPLFIYGGVGLGKTHLLHATGNSIIDNFPNCAVVYTTAENFVNEIVEGIRTFKMNEIKKAYRNIDCLIIDDIQFLAARERTQEEFFHTFNELYDNHKQIILSSDRPPRELTGIEDRLRSRFEMGMIVDVGTPDYETRLAILQVKAREHEAIIPQDVLEFIAYNVQDNVRTLEGILLQAIAKAKLEKVTPTVKMVARFIQKFDSNATFKNEEHNYTPENGTARTIVDVIDIVCQYYKISHNDLKGNIRKRELLFPRQISMFLCRQELNQSFERIGSEFGGRNHTTVMHAVDKIKELLETDHNLVRDVNAIKREMGL